MTNELKALGSDLDGTLVYQKPQYATYIVGKAFDELGIVYDDNFINEFVDNFWNGSYRDRLVKERLKINYMDFWHVFWKLDTPEVRAVYTEVYDDAVALKGLYDKGIRLGIVTKAVKKVAEAEIALLKKKVSGIEFESVVANDTPSIIQQKPNPHTIFISMRELNATNCDYAYLGNSEEDALATLRAGVQPIIVIRDDKTREVMKNFGDTVKAIDSLFELERIL